MKQFDIHKGFGFIDLPGKGDRCIFVHISDLRDSGIKSLSKGEPLEFTAVSGAKGLKAVKLRRLTNAPTETPKKRPGR